MTQPILTPISLWKDFDASLPLEVEIIEERAEQGILYRETAFSGRQTDEGRVRIYGIEVRPNDEEKLPAILLLLGANRALDLRLAERFARRGYCVFCMDYRGETNETGRFTEYPADVDYANFIRAERKVYHADEGAKRTAWYEWTAAAIYAVEYLKTLSYVTSIGAMGEREGGEIVWKLMTVTPLACGVVVNAVGWLSSRDSYKFEETAKVADMDEERRLFIAGVDSQSYAPFVKCPVLMLVATSDAYMDADKAYDTFARINGEQFATIHYSVGYGGTIDETGIKDVDMFADKYLKDREIFIAEPLEIAFETGEDGALYAVVTSDGQGESVADEVFFAEDSRESFHREWIRCDKYIDGGEDRKLFPIPLYRESETIFLFARSQYSSGFTVASKITYKKIEKDYAYSVAHSNVLYDNSMSGEFFTPVITTGVYGGCFLPAVEGVPYQAEGYGKITGMACARGLKTHRISLRRFSPKEKSLLHVNLYAKNSCYIALTVTHRSDEGVHESYQTEVYCEGGGRWKDFVLSAEAFKNQAGISLETFQGGHTLQFSEENGEFFVVNNILWV